MRVSLRGLYPQYTFFSGRDIGVRQSDHRTSSARRRELSSRIQLLIEDMLTRWLALDERIAARIKRFYRQGATIFKKETRR
jgi:hypothetical protein